MRYCGSKAKFIKELSPILTKHLDGENFFYDAFMGGANVISNIDYSKKVGIEINEYVYELWFRIQSQYAFGEVPFEKIIPQSLTQEEYKKIREEYINGCPNIEKWLVGYAGTCCSFGGAWFGGYAAYNEKKQEDHIKEAYNGLRKQVENFKSFEDTLLICDSYDNINYKPNSVIYCDPPYADTKKYESDFDHLKFWEWVREMSRRGHHVYVSEYVAPSDFKCIWSKEKKDGMGSSRTGISKVKIEKLFVYNGK